MTELLIVCTAVAWGLCWLVLGIADHVHAHRVLPPVAQPVRAAPPHLPSPVRAAWHRARIDRVEEPDDASRDRH